MSQPHLSFKSFYPFSIVLVISIAQSLDATSAAAVSKKEVPRLAARPRVTDSNQVLFTVKRQGPNGRAGMTAEQFAKSQKMKLVESLSSDAQMGVLTYPDSEAARKAIAKLKKNPQIVSASYNRLLPHVLHGFVSNDPLFTQEWHLDDGLDARPGVSVAGPWARGFTGKGVVIGIVDEGVEKSHEDIAPNFDAADSYDFAGRDLDPSPVGVGDVEDHGTSVAGVAAGAGGNSRGVTGAAPQAQIAGLKITFDGLTSLGAFVNAIKFHSFGANRAIKIKNHSYGFSFPFIEDTEEEAAFNESTAAGTIHTVSAGNDRYPYGSNADGTDSGDIAEDSNKSTLSNNPNIIAVAALASSGIFSEYSSLGSNIFVTAPSGGFREGELGITTTDRSGADGYNSVPSSTDYDLLPDLNYTTTFGGTSSSAPLVAGVLALVKQANPNLDVRLAKHLLAGTSIQVDPTNPTWVQNAAGYFYSTDYGFGLVDADALVSHANDLSITPLQIRQSLVINVNKPVPDPGSISQSIPFGETGKIEEIQVRLVVDTAYEGDLEATITSPSGTVSQFCHSSSFDSESGVLDWWFTSNAFWGENGRGNWTVTVSDAAEKDAITWQSVQLRVRSDSVPGVVIPSNDDFANAKRLSGRNFTATANLELATAEPGEPARGKIEPNHSVWYKWTAPANGVLKLDVESRGSTVLTAIYIGTSLEDLKLQARKNKTTNGPQGSFAKNVSRGTTYFIVIDSKDGLSKEFSLHGLLGH